MAKVLNRIASLEAEVENLKTSAASDTKSSMGDKYETAREMINLEKEKISEQLADAQRMKQSLESIEVETQNPKAALGSLIKSSTCYFYLSVSLGKVVVNGKEVFVISPASPIGKGLMGLQVNNSIEFAGKIERIIAVA
ncbi:MAG TPA: 3-oxoacyl-ACP synthase [Roseivirga sp.]